LTIDCADIGVVDITINQVGNMAFGVHCHSALMCCLHQLMKGCFIIEQGGFIK
jgi:hypothetical protein